MGVSNQVEPEFLRPPVRIDGPIMIAEPDSAWPGLYAREEERIRAALGPRALQVEHVGSTSVPGLAAKPILDIALVVVDSADEAAYVPDLESAGYVLHVREPGWDGHRLFRAQDPDVQVHVFAVENSEVERMLLFRDRLRSRPDERDLYERTKRALAARRWSYVQDYADAKSTVVEGIIARARHDQAP